VRRVPALTRRRLLPHFRDADPVLAAVIEAAGPYRLGADDRGAPPFEHLASAIIHQQLSGAAARTIQRRFVALHARFPEPRQLLDTPDEPLRAAGLSRGKVAALRDLAARTLDGTVPNRSALETLDDETIVARLTQVRGVGRWTVEMLLMFQLGRPDVLPSGDLGVRNGFRLAYGLREAPAPRALADYGARWAPFRSAAAWYLWRAVELAREGRLPPPPPRAPRLGGTRLSRSPSSRGAGRAAPRPRSGARTR
jgi:3-methyladenine DNA glycosylase/8-oxoguanine DNA glycosylase